MRMVAQEVAHVHVTDCTNMLLFLSFGFIEISMHIPIVLSETIHLHFCHAGEVYIFTFLFLYSTQQCDKEYTEISFVRQYGRLVVGFACPDYF